MRKGWLARGLLLAGWLLAGCTAVAAPATPPAQPAQAATPTLHQPAFAPAVASPSPIPDTGWQPLTAGEGQPAYGAWRLIRLFDDDGRVAEEITIVRLEPAQVAFRVAYQPDTPRTLRQWQTETGALLVVNGGFFTETFQATGLTVVAGQASGSSYGDFAGMFAVTAAGPEVRWLGARPYHADEPLQYALQSFPMLLRPGGLIGYPEEDGQAARRTAVAQDRAGRVLFILAPWGSFTLHELSLWLARSDLDLDTALNLDGGTSTGLLLAEPEINIPAFTRLPIVITVFPRPAAP